MITNERQYRITKGQYSKLRDAAEAFEVDNVASGLKSRELAEAEANALKSEIEALGDDIRDYEALKAGHITNFQAESIEELPRILIRGRIAKGLTQKDLADLLGIKEQQVQRYESEEYRSANLRRLSDVAKVLGLSLSGVAEFQTKPEKTAVELDWNRFPIKEMYRRGWFRDFSGSINAALAEADSIVERFVREVVRRPALAYHRKRIRTGSALDQYALLAWECRVLMLAKDRPPKIAFNRARLDAEWLRSTVQISRQEDGPARMKEWLSNVGITLVVEPCLPGTHLDGAALLHDDVPIIGMTLRYDRLDNFWFVLLHEIAHVMKHLRKGKTEDIFDDLDAAPDDFEKEADEIAGQSLIPDEAWETALARYLRTADSITTLAQDLKISPAIVAGKIRHEASNYVILSDMVGLGEVRKQFPDVLFGQ